jgi:hypothetical protein
MAALSRAGRMNYLQWRHKVSLHLLVQPTSCVAPSMGPLPAPSRRARVACEAYSERSIRVGYRRFIDGVCNDSIGWGRSQQLHARGDDFSALAFAITVSGFVLAGSQAALDKNLTALLQVLSANFAQACKSNDIVPFDPFLLVAVLVGEGFISCNREADNPLRLAKRYLALPFFGRSSGPQPLPVEGFAGLD